MLLISKEDNMAEKFETSLSKLENVVKRLESGELALDDALKAFEEGIKHAAICSKKLNEAEKKIELLLKQKDGSFRTEQFMQSDD